MGSSFQQEIFGKQKFYGNHTKRPMTPVFGRV